MAALQTAEDGGDMNITDNIAYVGVNDHDIDLFEGQYDVRKNGMSYNSYVVFGAEKVAVTDTVDAHFVDEWLGNLDGALAGRTPDYLVVHHMEPDHSAGIATFMERYPQATVVASAMAFKMMAAYFGTDFADRRVIVKEGSTLDLGGRTLTFVGAPNVHWPEVMFPRTRCCSPRTASASSARWTSRTRRVGPARRAATTLASWASSARTFRSC